MFERNQIVEGYRTALLLVCKKMYASKRK